MTPRLVLGLCVVGAYCYFMGDNSILLFSSDGTLYLWSSSLYPSLILLFSFTFFLLYLKLWRCTKVKTNNIKIPNPIILSVKLLCRHKQTKKLIIFTITFKILIIQTSIFHFVHFPKTTTNLQCPKSPPPVTTLKKVHFSRFCFIMLMLNIYYRYILL